MSEYIGGSDSWGDDTWAKVFRSILSFTAQPSENVDDILVGGRVLGNHRAEIKGRNLEIWEDIPFSLGIFCWWPFLPTKTPPNREYLLQNRGRLFHNASRSGAAQRRIIKAVPREILILSTEQLGDLFRNDLIRNYIILDNIES